jgi:Flp pilus assembly pilin Flp
MSIHPIINNTEEGQALVEYALILTLVSLAAVAALGLVGTQIQTLLNSIASYL